MRMPAVFVVLVALAPTARAGEPDVRGAIDRGLTSLADDAVAWKADRKCAKNTEPISLVGTAWAVLGLMHASPRTGPVSSPKQ